MNSKYLNTFMTVVKSKVEGAQALGSKTTWGTQDHLDALAKTIEANPGELRTVLTECYNISAFQQTLEKAFAGKGHFVRTGGKKGQSPSELYKALGIA